MTPLRMAPLYMESPLRPSQGAVDMSSAGANLPERKAAKKLGRCWVTIFWRQGLAEASEQLRDGPRTLREIKRAEEMPEEFGAHRKPPKPRRLVKASACAYIHRGAALFRPRAAPPSP